MNNTSKTIGKKIAYKNKIKEKTRINSNSKIKVIITLAFGIILLNIFFSINKSYSKVEVNYKTEYASSGDTLWSIAERESRNNKYYQDKDIRYIIYDLKQLNNISESSLSVGQEIKIPRI